MALVYPSPATTASLQLETIADGSMLFAIDGGEHRIRGLSPVGLERFRVSMRLSVASPTKDQSAIGKGQSAMAHSFHLDTIDLYQERARVLFARSAAKLSGVSEQHVGADLLQMIEKLEAARPAMRKTGNEANKNDAAITSEERATTLQYLKNPRLTECIVEDFPKCRLAGERATVLTAYALRAVLQIGE